MTHGQLEVSAPVRLLFEASSGPGVCSGRSVQLKGMRIAKSLMEDSVNEVWRSLGEKRRNLPREWSAARKPSWSRC